MMSRKDYEMIARAMRANIEMHARNDSPTSVQALEWLADDLATGLAAGNARFDRARFLRACGVTS